MSRATESRKRKLSDDDLLSPPANKKRRIALHSPPSSPPPTHTLNENIINNLVSSFQSEFSCAESSQFSIASCLNLSQQSQNESQSQSESQVSDCSSIIINRYAQNIPSVLLQHILSFSTPFELSIYGSINKFYAKQTKIRWKRLTNCLISPALFPSLIDDDYDSQFEYNPSRHPHRTHFTLNWIVNKIKCYAQNLQILKIERTMMNGQMFQILIKNCPNLTQLHLDENPWIFLLGRNSKKSNDNEHKDANAMDTDEIDSKSTEDSIEMFTANLFENVPTFKLQSFIIESMYMNLTDITFARLLSSSKESLEELVLKKRDPFRCSYCLRTSLCKWHKCEDCQLRSYCDRKCQSEDWWQHQYVCSYHDPNGVLQRLQSNNNQLNGGFLDTICSFKNLIKLDLTWCYIVHHTALKVISLNCNKLKHIVLNGCDINDQGIIELVTNLNDIETLHCRAARYVTDRSLDVLCKSVNHKSIKDLDISRCCLITKEGCLGIINSCKQLQRLSMACGIKRGGWLWTMDDDLSQAIITNLKGLELLEYITCSDDHKVLKRRNERKLSKINNGNIVIQKISTDQQTVLRNNNGHLTVDVIKYSMNKDPVCFQRIINGETEYQHNFRR